MKLTEFERAFRSAPACLVGAWQGDERTIADLLHVARIELDLIEEGQDGTDPRHAAPIRRWLQKWSPSDA